MLCGFAIVSGHAATIYVDGNCPSSGTGVNLACGNFGPKKYIHEGIALLNPGDTLLVRGAHAAHNGELGPFDGRYFANEFPIARVGTASARITIQPYGYTGPGTGETVFVDGTRPPSSGWTQCTDCLTGICAGVPAAGCSQTWYATDNGTAPPGFQGGTANLVLWAQKDDGSITYRVTSPSDLTNSHANYNPKRCAQATWKPCTTNSECGLGTCTATSAEIDAFSPQNGGPILVRWGASLPSKPYVPYNHSGDAFAFKSSSAYVTLQGFNMRAHRTATIYVDAGSSNHIIRDNRIFWGQCSVGAGHSYGITTYGPTNLTIEGNEIAYTVDEGIHGQAKTDGSPATVTIRSNWIHNQGDTTVFGNVNGTPSGMTLGESGGAHYSDWSGSVLENNLIANQKSNSPIGSPGYGLRIENASSNWIIRNNVFYGTDAQCIDIDGSDGVSDNNQVYNNLLINCGRAGINFWCSNAVRNTKVYNNTFVNCVEGAITTSNTSGICTGNEFRNNIMYDSASKRLVSWPIPGTFQNNLVYATGTGTLIAFNGRSFNCSALVPNADIDGDGAFNDTVRCLTPQFKSVSTNDFHLNATSPAINLGTTNGLPAGRTASINHTVASQRGFPDYAINDSLPMKGGAWDVGAIEFDVGVTVTAAITLSDSSPTAAGDVTVTLTTSVPVVSLPPSLTFAESDGSSTTITLAGPVPGSSFTGVFVVNISVADGLGTFSLPAGSLVDGSGGTGNVITSGLQTIIDKTPPAVPSNVTIQNQ
jgi:hypothetical protein